MSKTTMKWRYHDGTTRVVKCDSRGVPDVGSDPLTPAQRDAISRYMARYPQAAVVDAHGPFVEMGGPRDGRTYFLITDEEAGLLDVQFFVRD